MSQIANSSTRGRTWLWLGIAAAIVAITIFRVRVGTVVYVGVFLALPFFMMRMHGGGHAGGSGCGGGHGGSSEEDHRTRDPGEATTGSPALSGRTRPPSAPEVRAPLP